VVVAIKGVIVAAGYGTRFLPVTRVVPKELLPVVDRPAIDFVVQEMVEAGIKEILLISSRRKRSVEDWFDHDPELEAVFRAEGAERKLALVAPPRVQFTVVRQQAMRGTGHALWLAKDFAGSDPVVVAFPDDLFGGNVSQQLIARHRQGGGSVLSARDLRGQDVSRYGVLDVEGPADLLRLRGIVEKPARGTEPSSLVSLGRYLYEPAIFPLLEEGWARFEATGGREFYPMEAIATLAAEGRVAVEVIASEHYDTGEPLGYVQTVISQALQRADIGPALDAWLRARLGSR
jgi:UTP--glucose-1-phosphate uridylyltransferase